MYRKFIKIFCFCLILAIMACGTTVKYKIERAPEIILGKVDNIKIEKFKVDGNLDLTKKQDAKILEKIVEFETNRISKQEGDNELRIRFYSGLINRLSGNKFYNIVENTENYGVVLKGNIFYRVNDDYQKNKKTVTKKNKEGKKVEVKKNEFTLNRKAEVTVQMRAVDRKGKVLGSTTITANSSAQITDESLKKALNLIETWKSLVYSALRKTYSELYNKVIPYYTYERLHLEKGGSKKIKSANKMAKKGKWKKALKIWNSYKDSSNQKEKVAALHNIAIHYEVNNDLEKAVAIFKKLNQITNSSKFEDDIERIKERKQEEKELKREPQPKS